MSKGWVEVSQGGVQGEVMEWMGGGVLVSCFLFCIYVFKEEMSSTLLQEARERAGPRLVGGYERGSDCVVVQQK
jgi:hypothetical protein